MAVQLIMPRDGMNTSRSFCKVINIDTGMKNFIYVNKDRKKE